MNEVTDNVEVATEATEAPVIERPEWLPEKFETPEALASSYGELETKLGQDKGLNCRKYLLTTVCLV